MKWALVLSIVAMMGLDVFAQTPKVYVTREITPQSLLAVYKALGVKAHGKVAVKVSTGEAGNPNAPLKQRITSRHGTHTIDHAAEIGLGSKSYELVNIDAE